MDEKATVLAYIAGFLDGDGSIMLQIKPRPDCKFGYRITSKVVLYQKSEREGPLLWMREQFNIGYVSRRRDGISEYRVEGHAAVQRVLRALEPYLRFKQQQAQIMLEAIELLQRGPQTPRQFLEVCRLADQLANANYSTSRRYTSEVVEQDFIQRGLLSP